MKIGIRPLALLCALASAQQAPQTPLVKSHAEEVILDIVVRDKKGKPVTDLTPEQITVSDSGTKQTLTSFRLVRGAEAISPSGAATNLDPLQQIRLVTLAFEAMTAPDQRKLARSAALDLIKGEQGANVFYSVVVINTQLSVLQPFTTDKSKLSQAIQHATEGLGGPKLASESDAILAELKRDFGSGVPDTNLLSTASGVAGQTVTNAQQALDAKLASVMLDMLRMDSAVASQGARLSLTALKSLVQGLHSMPGRKSVLYFTDGMYVTPELDALFQGLTSLANRTNVSFYSVDARGVMTFAQNSDAAGQLNGAADASRTTILRTRGATTKEEIMASDNAEISARANTQLAIRDLAEATGGFLIGDSNDLRGPLRRVNEEVASYYELSFNPGIENYDGSFRKLSVSTSRKDLVIHARSGYFALPPEARSSGVLPYELPLLKAISDGKISEDVAFRSGAVLLQPKAQGTDVTLLVEVPLHSLSSKSDDQHHTYDVHCSLAALVKDSSGAVVQKVSRDRSFHVTAEQLKMGNFVDKSTVTIPPGKYTLETAVMDRDSGKVGVQRSAFAVAPKPQGVGISSLTVMHSYTPNAKGLTQDEPFQFQGGTVTPTLDTSISKAANSVLRLFFTVYQDPSIPAPPSVEVQFVQNGKVLANVPMQLPVADSHGRIPYLMTIPSAAIPPGSYEVSATARQGGTASQTAMVVLFLP